jgi:hypothetical protein
MGTPSKPRILVAVNIVKTPANIKINYWSPLSCLVEEQEEDDDAEHNPVEHLFLISTEESKPKSKNKITEKWR